MAAEGVVGGTRLENGRGEVAVGEGLSLRNVPTESADGDLKMVLDESTFGCGKSVGIAVAGSEDRYHELGMSVAELVAKARAPVKREFLTLAAVRVLAPGGGITGTGSTKGTLDEKTLSRVAPEGKSKRQLKRERLQAKRSAENICAIVARTGDVINCPYGPNCRFNHDLEGYKAQKPPDLPGNCPFLDSGDPCSYGIACRFAGTHKEYEVFEISQKRKSNIATDEQNSLSKELQKLLWKNMASYPKADAQLQTMGLMNKAFKLRKVEGEEDQLLESQKFAKEDTLNKEEATGDEITQTTTVLTLEARNTAPVASDCCKDQAGKEVIDIQETISGVLENLSCTGAQDELTSQSVSPALDSCPPPQKRLRTGADSAVIEEFVDAKDTQSSESEVGNVLGTLSEMDIDKDWYNWPGKVDVSAGDMLTRKPVVKDLCPGQAQLEDVRSRYKKHSCQSLYVESKLGVREKKIIDFRKKLYLGPLTTVGNLPFRRVCKALGADVTCGEMAMCTNLLQGQASEWALLRRHSSEDQFGVQICGSFPDHVARTAELIEQECTVDFIDINMGCPIDLVVNKGAGSCLLTKPQRLEQIVRATTAVMDNPLTLKLRMGYYEGRNCAHTLMPNLSEWGVSAVTIHGRTRQQRYSKVADWVYVQQCAGASKGNLQVIGNGDVFSYTDWNNHLKSSGSNLSTCMIARGALIKPWLFREIKECRHWDISSGERLDILKQYVHAGLAHWGSDSKGVETTRHFLLEWLSYMHHYIPVGLLEVVPQCLNWRPPSYFGRNDLETMMASESAADWVRISELLLGPVPANFVFKPKHKSNAYDRPENG